MLYKVYVHQVCKSWLVCLWALCVASHLNVPVRKNESILGEESSSFGREPAFVYVSQVECQHIRSVTVTTEPKSCHNTAHLGYASQVRPG